MTTGIMQPYFLPYLGYWQLLNHVDQYIVYDNIQFSKRGWFIKNNFLMNGVAKPFSLPLKKDSDYLNVDQRMMSPEREKAAQKILEQIKSAYAKAPYFKEVYSVLQECFLSKEDNLFEFLTNSITVIKDYLNITTNIIVSSSIEIDHDLKGKDKVLSLCKAVNTTKYVNPIGGVELYDKEEFKNEGVELGFIKMDTIEYPQFKNNFVPNLSIIDVIMFNTKEEIKTLLDKFSIV